MQLKVTSPHAEFATHFASNRIWAGAVLLVLGELYVFEGLACFREREADQLGNSDSSFQSLSNPAGIDIQSSIPLIKLPLPNHPHGASNLWAHGTGDLTCLCSHLPGQVLPRGDRCRKQGTMAS